MRVCDDRERIAEELQRILSSSGFVRNARMSQFLRFVVERDLDGRNEELKESVIAVEVFGRRPDYDPKLDSIVRTEAARLRSRLALYYSSEGRGDPLIIDLPKGGYVPQFREADASPAFSKGRPAYRWLAAACLVTVVTSALGWWWIRTRTAAPIRIAVLPLRNLTPESSDDYFADGLTAEIIRNLSVIDGLIVRSQTSSFVFKGQPHNARDAANQLDVEYLLEGSMLRDGTRLRIDAQLIRARDDVPLWSGRYDRQLTDTLAIQDEISRGIVNNLRLQLGHGRRKYETSAEAYELYLRARGKSVGHRPQEIFQSVDGFEQVIAKDAAFAPAYAALGVAYALRSAQFPLQHPPDELDRMRFAAEKAIQLDPLLAEAHHALALANARDGDWAAAERGFRRAIELDANDSRSYTDFAMWLLLVVGRNDEAVQQLRMAERADPFSSQVHLGLAWALMSVGRFDDAASHCERMAADEMLKVQCLGRARLGQGRIVEAIQLFASDPELPRNPQARGFLGYAYARGGRRQEAEAMATGSQYANEQALIYAGLGDRNRTLDALERMAAIGPQRLGRYLNSPELASLHHDSRLRSLRLKVGLPPSNP